MALKSSGRKLSFEILIDHDEFPFHQSNSDPIDKGSPNRKKKKHKKKKPPPESYSVITEDPITDTVSTDSNSVQNAIQNGNVLLESRSSQYNGFGGGGSGVCTVSDVVEVAECQSVYNNSAGELRQRNVSNGGGGEEMPASSLVEEQETEESGMDVTSAEKQRRIEPNGSIVLTAKLETAESLDWNRLMAEDPNYLFSVEASPLKYFMDEMYKGNSLRSTTTLGSEKERERVYDTIFRLPWRCELLIDVGFFVCLDSFLSLLTIMPTRILMTLWRLINARQFKKPSAAELSDLGCFIVLVSGVALLERTDISLIYHMIRGQGTIKLYVVYNVLEIFDKLCQSFGGDVLQTLFNSAEGLASCSEEDSRFWILRFISDQALATAFSILHSFILLAQAITLSTCIVAHNNALLALLVSNNFAEIKSSVFKRFSKDNIHSLVYAGEFATLCLSSTVL